MDAATWLKSLEDPGGQERRARLAELATYVNAVKTLEELAFEVPARINAILNTEHSVVYALDGQARQLYSLNKVGQLVKEARIPHDQSSLVGVVATAKVPLAVKNLQDTAELGRIGPKLKVDGPDRPVAGAPKGRSMLGVPMLID